jgi:hypothetical protein
MATIDDIAAVRLKTSDRSTITREVKTATGDMTIFRLDHGPIVAGSLLLWVDSIPTTTGFTVDEANGMVTFAAAPAAGAKLEFQYYWTLFTDDEVQYFLDESSGSVNLASARLLMALAADAAKLAQRETLQGGGGLGAVTRDTAVTSKELRDTAKALIAHEKDLLELAGVEPADGLTEVPWTEMSLRSLEWQDILRELDI